MKIRWLHVAESKSIGLPTFRIHFSCDLCWNFQKKLGTMTTFYVLSSRSRNWINIFKKTFSKLSTLWLFVSKCFCWKYSPPHTFANQLTGVLASYPPLGIRKPASNFQSQSLSAVYIFAVGLYLIWKILSHSYIVKIKYLA